MDVKLIREKCLECDLFKECRSAQRDEIRGMKDCQDHYEEVL